LSLKVVILRYIEKEKNFNVLSIKCYIKPIAYDKTNYNVTI